MHIEWLHNDKPIPFSSRMQMNHNFGFAVLDISYCIPEDAGLFKLRVTNNAGEAVSECELICIIFFNSVGKPRSM